MNGPDRYSDAYREEAGEILAELEGSLLELEERPDDAELVGRVFRALHTIKGSGAMFGFEAIAAFTHEVETIFDQVREGRTKVTPELVGATLEARDHILALLQLTGADASSLQAHGIEILDRLRQASGAVAVTCAAEPAVQSGPPETDAEGDDLRTWRIHFEPVREILLSGVNPLLLLKELRQLGEFRAVAQNDHVPTLGQFNPEHCYVYWDILLTTTAGVNAIRDVFIFTDDLARITIEPVETAGLDGRLPLLGEVLVDRGDVTEQQVEECLATKPLTGELLVRSGTTTAARVAAALAEQEHLAVVREKSRSADSAATLRVPATKLDDLVNIAGELVTVQARLTSYATASKDPEVKFICEEVERLTERLRENSMSLRMRPVGETFGRFRRMVRDLCSSLGKEAELTTSGDDTELDKTVIEQLSDPLVHIIRNSMDHGIETPEKRKASGKPAAGRVHLSASHTGAFVTIRVIDDGAGLNREAIRARAVERGLIRPDAVLSEQQIDGLIFTPGFSTAAKVTEVSGRGVGMDVVQRNLDALRGSLAVSSVPGAGTTVTLKIPLTLAIIDGLLVETGDARYVVPLASVSGCVELPHGEEGASNHKLLSVRGEFVPCVTLRDWFKIPGKRPEIEQAIIAETHNGLFGFVVDRVIGDHHTVIKKLGRLYRDIDELSGATILGDGSLALILDVEKLAVAAIREARSAA